METSKDVIYGFIQIADEEYLWFLCNIIFEETLMFGVVLMFYWQKKTFIRTIDFYKTESIQFGHVS